MPHEMGEKILEGYT